MISATSYGDVFQIKMSRYVDFPPASWVCAYLIDGLLIDTGPAYTAEELAVFLNEKVLKLAVNTHFHEDHISANKYLQDGYGIEILAHPMAVDKISKPAKLYPYQEDVWGYPVPSQVKPVGSCIETENYCFEVIPTPGHDLDHICLFERKNGWLFTGDLYVTTQPVVCRPNDDLWQIMEDVRKLRLLNPNVIFPAPTHVVKEPREKLDKLLLYLEGLGSRVEELYNRGRDEEQIRQEIFGAEGIIAEATQQQFSSLNMVKSILRKYKKSNAGTH